MENTFQKIVNNNMKDKTFDVCEKHKKLIDEIADLFYKTNAVQDLINSNNNTQAISILSDKYTEYFSQCESKKNLLKYEIVGDDPYVTDYSISFASHTITFTFKKNITDSFNLDDYIENVYNKYKEKYKE